ncbi:MAG: hypothetical protein Q8912_00020 [Bacillota bacterium]|nr:hypothetical protein [Bacillota bacterium]MDP4158426.1 hypothetical protein [Bacillota bacterium]
MSRVGIEYTPVRIQIVINTPFRVLVLFVVAALIAIIAINPSLA